MPIMADVPSAQPTASESSALSDAGHCAPFVPGHDGDDEPDELPEGTIECSICLQSCIHPVRLPCSHIFCFLCVKGVANHSKRCALCRSEIPPDFLLRPLLLDSASDDALHAQAFDGKYQWFYEGVRGWWQYDVRASAEIEGRYQSGERVFEMLIAGFLYIVDMEGMVQYRRNTPSRRRRIKRDLVDIPDKKGVAGLSCKMRPPRRTGGDGGEREDALAAAAARALVGGHGQAAAIGTASNNNNSAQVGGVMQLMRDLTLTAGDGVADDGNPQGTRGARSSDGRLAAADGVDRADTSPVRQTSAGSRSRQAHDAAVDGQPYHSSRINRVNAALVDGQSAFGPRPSRSDVVGQDATGDGQPSAGARISSRARSDAMTNVRPSTRSISRVSVAGLESNANTQPTTSGRINSRVISVRPDANGQPSSLNSRGIRVDSPEVDVLGRKHQKQGTRMHERSISQRVKSTSSNDQPVSSSGVNQVVNETVADRASQPVVQNNVDHAAGIVPAVLDRVNHASLDLQGTSPTGRRIEGRADTDRADHVDRSSDSD